MDILQPQGTPIPEEIQKNYETAQNQVILWENEVTTLKRAKMAEQSEIEDLVNRHKDICSQIDSANASLDSMAQTIQSLRTQISDLNDDINSKTKNKGILASEIDEMTQKLADTTKDLQISMDAIAKFNSDSEQKTTELNSREEEISKKEAIFKDALKAITL